MITFANIPPWVRVCMCVLKLLSWLKWWAGIFSNISSPSRQLTHIISQTPPPSPPWKGNGVFQSLRSNSGSSCSLACSRSWTFFLLQLLCVCGMPDPFLPKGMLLFTNGPLSPHLLSLTKKNICCPSSPPLPALLPNIRNVEKKPTIDLSQCIY